jgi:hypothetical protein
MAKRNARKQASRAELEESDVVCRKLAMLADEADLLMLTQGADYDVDANAREYDTRLAYLSVLLSELIDYRVTLLLAESLKPDDVSPAESPESENGPEDKGDPDGDATETE